MDKTCETCKHWAILPPGMKGSCRRYPPTVSNMVRSWPETLPDEWCGEYAKRTSKKAPAK